MPDKTPQMTDVEIAKVQEWFDAHPDPITGETHCASCEVYGIGCRRHFGRDQTRVFGLWQVMPSVPMPPIRERTPQELAEAYGSPAAAYKQRRTDARP